MTSRVIYQFKGRLLNNYHLRKHAKHMCMAELCQFTLLYSLPTCGDQQKAAEVGTCLQDTGSIFNETRKGPWFVWPQWCMKEK